MQISNFPRVKLCYLPTPFHEVKRLSEKLNGPRIFFKRDDLIGLGLGGNKVRKLEFLFGEALAKGADVVLTDGPIQSNHARQVAAAGASLGLETHLILQGEEPLEYKGNLLACYIFGAKLHFIKANTMDEDIVAKRMEEVADELRQSGKNPYVIPIGGFTPRGSVAYAFATLEMLYQANEAGVHIDYICHSTSTGGTQAGLIAGNRILRSGIEVLGIRATYDFEPFETRVSQEAIATLRLMGYPEISIKPEEVRASRDYVGDGYDCPTKEAAEAILLVAQTEGILLDPVYTGKAMAGLIDLCKKGLFSNKDVVVFWHTGGIPGLFVGPEFYGKDLVKKQSHN